MAEVNAGVYPVGNTVRPPLDDVSRGRPYAAALPSSADAPIAIRSTIAARK